VSNAISHAPEWPALNFPDWADTAETLHLWSQIVGKVRMTQTPWQNHAWHVTLYVTPRGLTTGTIPHGRKAFSLDFDFFDHVLRVDTCDGARETIALAPKTVADFYDETMAVLERVGRPVTIHPMPNEIADAIPFPEDRVHASYHPEAVQRFWRVLHNADRLFRKFRSQFWGKASPSHFFWGSFDLAVTRFSGRPAPDHPGGLPNMPLWIAQEAYSHEVSSAGFWSGSREMPEPIFYSYAYPTPDGMSEATVRPTAARWSTDLGEFVLPLEAVRTADDPDATLMEFLESTFDVAARLGRWDLTTQQRRHFPG
jgi:hypothetical protein